MDKDDIQKFNRALSKFNGYLDINNNSNYGEAHREELQIALNIGTATVENISNHYNNLYKIRLGLTNCSLLGAVACKFEDTYFVGIHAGTIPILGAIFNWMLRSPRVFPKFGDASNEQLYKIEDPHIIESGRLIDIIESNPENYSALKNQKRAELAGILTTHALRFLILHELGHILCGHIDHLIATTSESSFLDLTEVGKLKNEKDGLVSQAAELDADAFSVRFSLYQLQGTYQYMLDNKEFSIFKNFPQLLGTWVFSTYALFRLIGLKEYDASKLRYYTHPAPGLRCVGILVELEKQVHNGAISKFCSNELRNKLTDFVQYYMSNVEDAFEDINLYRAKAAEGADYMTFANKYPEHVADVLGALNELRVNLRSFVKY